METAMNYLPKYKNSILTHFKKVGLLFLELLYLIYQFYVND